MPALSRARTRAIARLGEQLRFAPRATLLKHLDRIEALAAILDPEGVYPEDFVVFRVTGYRPELDEPELLGGAALLGDLSALAERLSEHAGCRGSDLDDAGFETIDALASRWGVSRKSIERYRRLGLVGRRVDRGSGRRAVVFSARAVSLFEERHADRLGRAARFTRLTDHERARACRWARRYRDTLGWGISRAAERIASRLGRSRECIRAALASHDEGAPDPVFGRAPPPDRAARAALLARAVRGERPGALAADTDRRAPSVARQVNRARLDQILASGVLREHADEPEDPALLAMDPVARGLGVETPGKLTDLMALMRRDEPAVVYEQRERARAARTLAARCARRAARLDHANPSGRALDEIETAMRWIMMLRLALLRTQLHLIVATLEEHLGGRPEALGPARAREIVLGAIDAGCDAVRRYDPGAGGRLAARVGLALTRHASRLRDAAPASTPGRAGRGIGTGHDAPDWADHLWRRWWWIRPPAHALAALGTLDERDRAVLTDRLGLTGERPITLDELAEIRRTSRPGAVRLERGALRRLWASSETPARRDG